MESKNQSRWNARGQVLAVLAAVVVTGSGCFVKQGPAEDDCGGLVQCPDRVQIENSDTGGNGASSGSIFEKMRLSFDDSSGVWIADDHNTALPLVISFFDRGSSIEAFVELMAGSTAAKNYVGFMHRSGDVSATGHRFTQYPHTSLEWGYYPLGINKCGIVYYGHAGTLTPCPECGPDVYRLKLQLSFHSGANLVEAQDGGHHFYSPPECISLNHQVDEKIQSEGMLLNYGVTKTSDGRLQLSDGTNKMTYFPIVY